MPSTTITMPHVSVSRRLPVGAEVQTGGGVHFRVWAADHNAVDLVLEPGGPSEATQPAHWPMTAEEDGYFSLFLSEAGAGTRYRFRLDGSQTLYPDPASRFQPQGVHGPSEAVDPSSYAWRDNRWPGVALEGQVVYELHVGTFTPEGTWAAAAEKLGRLADLGIGTVEVMPVAEFVGRFGWGYDGVDLFAPTRLYGRPDDFRRFVDEAHAHGLGVILDVVHNHFGPTGNYLGAFSKHYASQRHMTDWGHAINFRRRQLRSRCASFFVANAGYWIDEYHLDGLRLDAIHAIADDSPDHIIAAITRRVRQAGGRRRTLVVVENERQEARVVEEPAHGGFGADALWNDDFHHAARVAITGPQRILLRRLPGDAPGADLGREVGFLYQGQWNARQEHSRGTPAWHLPAKAVRDLHPESRPGGQLGPRAAEPVADVAGATAGGDRAAIAGPGNAHALSGAGIRLYVAVPVLRRSRSRSG